MKEGGEEKATGKLKRRRSKERKNQKNRPQDIAAGEYVLFKSVLSHPPPATCAGILKKAENDEKEGTRKKRNRWERGKK